MTAVCVKGLREESIGWGLVGVGGHCSGMAL